MYAELTARQPKLTLPELRQTIIRIPSNQLIIRHGTEDYSIGWR